MSENSIDFRLTNSASPQFIQTGVKNSTDNGVFATLSVTGTATIVNSTITNLAVSSSFTVQSSALKSMAFQSATGANAILSNSSWLNGPVSSTSLSSTAAAIVAVNSSWQSGPVTSTAINGPVGLTTPSTGKFTELVSNSSAQVLSLFVSSGIAFGSFVSDLAVVLTGYIQIKTSTGGTVNLAVVSS